MRSNNSEKFKDAKPNKTGNKRFNTLKFAPLLIVFSTNPASHAATTADNPESELDNEYANLINIIAQKNTSSTDSQSPSLDIEKSIFKAYDLTERHCATQINKLTTQKAIYEKKDAHVNAWGGLVALIGGVASYAPVKAVLMGVGISSSGGSNSVLGGMANSFNGQASNINTEISSLKSSFEISSLAYANITSKDDPTGTRRFYAITRLRARCDGLTALSSQDK